MRHYCLFLIAFAAACASAPQRPASVAAPEMEISLANPIFFGSGSSAPAQLDVAVTNRATVPLRVVRLRIESSGMSQYAIAPYERNYSHTIPPGETRVINVPAMAYARNAGSRPVEPLSLRIFGDFEAGTARFREISFQQLRP